MSRLLDLPPELILSIMNFAAYWSGDAPDYESVMAWSTTCKSLGACAQSILFSHVILTNVHSVRSFSAIIKEQSEMGKYFRQRVHVLEVFCKDELGVSSIHLHDFVKLLPWLPNLKSLALDLDRFYTFAPISLAKLRHASTALTSITLKPSCGWTQLQVLERLPSLTKVHYISHSPFDHPTQLSHYATPCPIAFKEITHTSVMSPFGFRSLIWLLTCPQTQTQTQTAATPSPSSSSGTKPSSSPPQIDLLALLGTAPEDSILGSILAFAGARIRRLHIEKFSPTWHLISHCNTLLEELVIGVGETWVSPSGLDASGHLAANPSSSPPPFDVPSIFLGEMGIGLDYVPGTPPPMPRRRPHQATSPPPKTILASVPSSVRKLIVFGKPGHMFPLDVHFPDALELLEQRGGGGLTGLRELGFVVDDAPTKLPSWGDAPLPNLFSHAAIEKDWRGICQRLGINLMISVSTGCTAPRYKAKADNDDGPDAPIPAMSMMRPGLISVLYPN